MGNETRFINHLPLEISNLNAQEVYTKDGKQLLFFFQRNVNKDEELFFDYGKEFTLPWKTEFDKVVNKTLENERLKMQNKKIEKEVKTLHQRYI